MSPTIAYSMLFHGEPRHFRWALADHQVIAAAIREAAAHHPPVVQRHPRLSSRPAGPRPG
jgi:hypothetical protein